MKDNDGFSHMLSFKTLIGILVLLLILTFLTVEVSSLDLGKLNVWVALTIAAIKSSLVILYFMHMKFESMAIKISFVSTVGFVAILIGFLFWDIAYR
ncbi:MAG: cytochrome C oxidase subunit IV family protein [Desulfosalsimonadaceae bacterium]|nr:cytochrome C oxidase subunit IV family protein [Desulfosalsimonadaceae bacterium]